MTTIAIDVGNVTLDELLARVERGESVALTRAGQRLATILPEPGPPTEAEREGAREAYAVLTDIRRRLRESGNAVSFEEFKQARDEGRR